jgi:TolB-like protein
MPPGTILVLSAGPACRQPARGEPRQITMPQSAVGTDFSVFRFGVFQFHPGTLALTRQGAGIRLQTQPARVLTLLLSRAGELVTRETIRESLWHDGTTVDFEVGVNRCVRQLRAALGDDIGAPRYIKTIPRLGYCFIAAVAAGRTVPTTAVTPAPQRAQPPEAEMHPSIVVLPFDNISGDAQDEYFTDGLAEEITNVLAQIPGLKVIARTSAFAFKGKHEDVRKIGDVLGVNNVLEGSVRRSGARVRVTAQLIHAADGAHLSSKRYDREITDIFALQDEIAADVARQLRFHLGVARHSITNLKAYEAYLEGRFHWNKFAPSEFEKGMQAFERAVAIDPRNAAAYTGIAQCCLGQISESGLPALDYLPKAAAAARRALDLDEGDAEAHAAMGHIAAILHYDWTEAEWHYRRALELNPTPYVRMAYIMFYLLPHGRAAEGAELAARILDDDPLHLIGRVVRAAALMFARDVDAAAECCLRVLEIDGAFAKAIQTLSLIRGYQARFDESVRLAERLVDIVGRAYASLYPLAIAHAMAGNAAAARSALQELENLPDSARGCPSRIGMIYAALGEIEPAFTWLERAVEEHEPTLLWIGAMPRTAGLRQHPRFQALLEKMNLNSYSAPRQ